MTRKFNTTGAALMAVTGAAILAFAGSGHTMNTPHVMCGDSSAQTRGAVLHAHGFADCIPPIEILRHREPVVPPAPRVPNRDVDTGESSNPTSTKQMYNHGGAVQTSPHIFHTA